MLSLQHRLPAVSGLQVAQPTVYDIARAVVLPELRRATTIWDVLIVGLRVDDPTARVPEPARLGGGYEAFSIFDLRGRLGAKDLRFARKVLHVKPLPGCIAPPTRWIASVSVDPISADHVCEIAVCDAADTVLGRWRITVDSSGKRTGSTLTLMPYLTVLACQFPFFEAIRFSLHALHTSV